MVVVCKHIQTHDTFVLFWHGWLESDPWFWQESFDLRLLEEKFSYEFSNPPINKWKYNHLFVTSPRRRPIFGKVKIIGKKNQNDQSKVYPYFVKGCVQTKNSSENEFEQFKRGRTVTLNTGTSNQENGNIETGTSNLF